MEKNPAQAGEDGRIAPTSGVTALSSASMPVPGDVGKNRRELLISSLSLSDSPRLEGEDPHHVQALAEVDVRLPPILVHGRTMRVIDGMHRVRAAVLRGEAMIEAELVDGSEIEVFVRAVQANIAHGLPLSLRDRKAAAARIAGACPQWSDRAIARVTGLSPKTVAAVRCSTEEVPHLKTRVGQDGRPRPVDASEGRRIAREVISRRPGASLREVAKEAGISVSTAHSVRKGMQSGDNEVVVEGSRHDQQDRPELPPAKRTDESDGKSGGPRISAAVLQGLMNDPSLKLTQCGRALLRLLAAHSMEPDYWDRIVEATPAHCANIIAELADNYAKAWERLGRELKKRSNAVL
ncbi:streptomycin biosynthesis protein [Saccharopolyspora sp. 5N102]|uniref:streptomycin biosynthesis protein n=1 Tax=Saccharopolyspora sp. 5N102 TaxID=3375155 RepID=UPI0037AB486D